MLSRLFSYLFKNKKNLQTTPTFNLQLDFTYDCNLRCRHCYQRSNDRENASISFEDWLHVIDQYFKLCRQLETNTALTLSGGEPLRYRHLKPLIEHVRNTGRSVDIYLLSNGTLLNDEIAAFFKEHRVNVQISLDGPTEETNDYFRGRGSFLKALRGAGILNHFAVPFTFQAVLQRRTAHLIADFFKVAKQHKARSMDFARLMAVDSQDYSEMLVGLELKKALTSILDCSRAYHVHTNTLQPLWCLIDPDLGHPSSAGFLDMTVGPDGVIQLTSRIKESIGNALDRQGLSKAYYDGSLLKSLRAGKINGCSKCELFRKCRGDRNVSYLTFGNFLGPDEHCWHWKEIVSKLQ